LRGFYKTRIDAYYVLKNSGFMDDFNASITIKFTDSDEKLITAGFYPRMTNEGGYGVYISPIGSYNIGYFTLDEKGDFKWSNLVDWTYHASIRKDINTTNRLRMICDGERFRIYLNGVLATSLRDNRYRIGKLHVVVEPNGKRI